MKEHRKLSFAVCVRVGLVVGCLLFVSSLELGSPPVVFASTAFAVNTASDGHDSNLLDGSCNNGAGSCSLRAAIEQGGSFVTPPVTIKFTSLLANQTLTLDASLGTIEWNGNSITVDGETKNVTISGASLNPGTSIFRIQGNSNTLRNLTIRDAPQDGVQIGDFAGVGGGVASGNTLDKLTIIGSGASGVYITGQSSGGQNNTISGLSRIGMSNSAVACVPAEANNYGVYIAHGAISTTVSSNYIGCNTLAGIKILGSGFSYNTVVVHNDIGTNGAIAQSNGTAGIYFEAAGGASIDGNLISGNGEAGVWIYNSSYVTVTSNYIGINVDGTAAIPNGNDGIALTDGTNNVTVGGTALADRNVISGNAWCGVRIRDNATLNYLNFNYMGLNGAGTGAVPNGAAGICVFNNSNNNTIGLGVSGVSQFISGNTREGVYIENSAENFVGQANYIGVAADRATPLGNGWQGVMLNGAYNTDVFAKLIANNGGAGVAVIGATATGNMITVIENHDNASLPIDLGNDGFTPNGSHTPPGPNNWLNYPVITGGSGSSISGTACNNCTVIIFRAIGNPGAPRGGGIGLTSVSADASGNWSATLPTGLTRGDISLVACQSPCYSSGNTSEMSPRWQLDLPLIKR